MKQNPRIRRGFTLVELLVVIVIIAALAGLTAPMVIRQRKKADQTEAVNNAKQIGLAMFEFENEYGSYPDGSLGGPTGPIAARAGGSLDAPTTITTSNDAFLQLIAAGIASSEQMFFCKTSYSTIKPDNVASTTIETLKKGDVGFGYIMGTGNKAFSASGNPGRVLLAAPLKYAGSFTAGKFDANPYDSKAVVLKIDNSVTSLAINKDGDAVLGGVKKLLDVGADTVWADGLDPVIVNPDPK
jgi:prepilin-type N-terminal cleavage/methylation domain-containing protein